MEDRPLDTEQQEEGEAEEEPKDNFIETWLKFIRSSGAAEELSPKKDFPETKNDQEQVSRKGFWDRFSELFNKIVSPPESKSKLEDRPIVNNERNEDLENATNVNEKIEIPLAKTEDSNIENEIPLKDIDEPPETWSEPEQVGDIVKRIEKNTATNIPKLEPYLPHNEAKTSQEVKKLKKQAKSLKKEQEELQKQRLEFEKQLDKQLKNKEKVNDRKIPHARPKTFEAPKFRNEKTNIPSEEQLREILRAGPDTQPEVVMERVEAAADHNIPIESLYERRHERKDDNSVLVRSKYDQEQVIKFKKQAESLRAMSSRRADLPASATSPNKKLVNRHQLSSGLYGQAIVSGFWTAIFLLAIIFILVLLS